MKKVLIIVFTLIIVLIINLNNNVYAYTGNGFVWSRSDLYVDVNTSFDSYISQIDVKFYYNGNLTNEDVIVELDRFYYGSNTIATDTVCDKNVMLYAYVPGYTNYSRKNILVHIVDNEYPVIKQIKSLSFGVKESFSEVDYFSITDNNKIDESTIKYDYKEYELAKLGEHLITVSASDVAGNRTERTFTYNIIDKNKPTLSTASKIEIEYGSLNVSLSDFVTAYDEEDGDLTNAISYSGYDPYKIGNQLVTFSVEDSSGNKDEVVKEISVVDLKAPTLELTTYSDTYYIEDIDTLNLNSYISKVYDNVDELSFDDVIIETGDLSKAIGNYQIAYTLFDKAKNYTKRYLSIQIRYKSAPIIEASDFTIEVGDSIDWSKYVSVSSLYDQNVSTNYSIDSKVLDPSQIGTYEVIIEAMDYAGNETTKSIMVTVKNDNSSATKDSVSDIYTFIYNNKLIIIVVIVAIFIYLIIFIKKKNKKLGY